MRTGGESDVFTRSTHWVIPKDYRADEDFESYYARNADKFARAIRRQQGLPRTVVDRIAEFRKPDHEQPYLILKGLYPTRFWFSSYSCTLPEDFSSRRKPTNPKPYIRDHIYDLISSTLLHELGTQHRPKNSIESKVMYRDYFTDPSAQHDQFTKDNDISLRFRPVDPELLFSNDPDAESSDVAPRYAIFVCVENPINDPLLLLPVKNVFDKLDEETRVLLQGKHFDVYDHWAANLSDTRNSKLKRLLQYQDDDPLGAQLSFDPNRINLKNTNTTLTHKRAVAELREKIKLASSEAIQIPLQRGEALVIDNYRAMVRRAESDHAHAPPMLWGKPAVRWIRLYAGFPRFGVTA